MSFVNVFQYVLISYSTFLICSRSSVVEHTLGKNGTPVNNAKYQTLISILDQRIANYINELQE